MSSVRKERICTLLKGIETGDPAAVAVVDQEKYIQHNPQTHEGSEGFLAGVHSSCYDLFRVAEGKLLEHWDAIEALPAPSEWKNRNGKF